MIAGTGAAHTGSRTLALARILHHAGHHVALLPSPTHPSFIVTAASTMAPGDLGQDAEGLYRVMEIVWSEVERKHGVEASAFHLAGDSLGAAQAAFVARLDVSAQVLDHMLVSSIPGGDAGVPAFFNSMMAEVTRGYAGRAAFDASSDFFYRLDQERDALPDDPTLREQRLRAGSSSTASRAASWSGRCPSATPWASLRSSSWWHRRGRGRAARSWPAPHLAGFSRCPPNAWRIADSTLFWKSASPREENRW